MGASGLGKELAGARELALGTGGLAGEGTGRKVRGLARERARERALATN